MNREFEWTLDKVIHLHQVRGMVSHSMDRISPDDAAYLFATGKSELEIRNALALWLHDNLTLGHISIREWRRHDLAVLDAKLQPLMILEGKVWSHTDVVTPKKLMNGKKSIRAELENDLNKLAHATEKYPGVNVFITIVLFSIDIDGVNSSTDYADDYINETNTQSYYGEVVKYASLHRRGIRTSGGLDNLMDNSREKLRDLLSLYGESMSLPLWTGSFYGVTVKSEIFILEPELTLLDEYRRR